MYHLLKISQIILIALSSNLLAQSFLTDDDVILRAPDAFIISGDANSNYVKIKWLVADGYYLYKDSLKISYGSKELEYKILNSSESTYSDEFFGETQILKEELLISFNIANSFNKNNILIYFQGCSESGFCYPMQTKNLLDIIL